MDTNRTRRIAEHTVDAITRVLVLAYGSQNAAVAAHRRLRRPIAKVIETHLMRIGGPLHTAPIDAARDVRALTITDRAATAAAW